MAHNSHYSEDTGYVNIHGKDIRVLVSDKTGSIAVPIDELKGMGFRIYRKSQYSKLLIDDNQFEKEFYLYMLECAQTYLLEKETVFKENDILENINKVKAALTGSQSNEIAPKTPHSNFVRNHVIEKSPDSITITASLREPLASTKQSLQNDRKIKDFNQNTSRSFLMTKNSEHFKSETSQNHSGSNETGERRFFAKSTREDSNQFGNSIPRTERNSFDQRRNGSESRNSFDRSSTFEQRKSLSPRTSTGNNFESRQNGQQKRGNSDSHEEPVKRLETVELNNPEHDVLITFVDNSNFMWVQDVNNAEDLLDIDVKVKEQIAKEEPRVVRFIYNKIYLALSPEDNMWYRCRTIKFKPLTVFFVDYGNTSEVTEIREASESLLKIPCQAVKVQFHERQYTPQVYDNITIKIKKRFDVGTYAVDVKTTEEPSSSSSSSSAQVEPPKVPTVPTFFVKPKPLCQLEDGQRVMLFSRSNGKLALRTKECYDKLKQIERALDEEEVKAKPVEKVEKGQLLLCKRDKLQRAVVTDVQKSTVEVEFLDYYETIRVDLSQLRYVNEGLAKQPLTYILTPQIKGYDDAAEEVLRELCEKMTKGTVVLSSKGDFDIKLTDELLSHKLKPQHSDRPMLKDFKCYKPPLGVGNYVLNVYINKNNIYFASEEVLTEYLECVMKSDLEDNNPYEPIVGEVCLGLYQDSWTRCVILNAKNPMYEVRFIDFGNSEFLKSDQLGKLTDDGKEAPILAFSCQLTGLPSISDVENSLQKHLSEGNNYDIIIKKFNGVTYEIEITAIYEALRK